LGHKPSFFESHVCQELAGPWIAPGGTTRCKNGRSKGQRLRLAEDRGNSQRSQQIVTTTINASKLLHAPSA
jgi:hypothetical protein